MSLPVVVQLYSVRDAMEADFYRTIKKMKELGYDGVEFAGLFGEEVFPLPMIASHTFTNRFDPP